MSAVRFSDEDEFDFLSGDERIAGLSAKVTANDEQERDVLRNLRRPIHSESRRSRTEDPSGYLAPYIQGDASSLRNSEYNRN